MTNEHPERLDNDAISLDVVRLGIDMGVYSEAPQAHPVSNLFNDSHEEVLEDIRGVLLQVLNRLGLTPQTVDYAKGFCGAEVENQFDVLFFEIIDSFKALASHYDMSFYLMDDDRDRKLTATAFTVSEYRFGDPEVVATTNDLLLEVCLACEELPFVDSEFDYQPQLEADASLALNWLRTQVLKLVPPPNSDQPSAFRHKLPAFISKLKKPIASNSPTVTSPKGHRNSPTI